MAKRVKLDPALGTRINETELSMLVLIKGQHDGSTVMGIDEMSERVGKSKATVRRSLRLLETKGLITVMSRYLRNGGQLENEYRVTDFGRKVVDAAPLVPRG